MALEKIITVPDLLVMGIAVGIAAVGTGMYAVIDHIETARNAWEISTPIPWAEAYHGALKTFLSTAKYSLPISMGIGYIVSKIIK